MERLTLYLKESYNELVNNVTWPTWSKLQSTSIVVIIASIILTTIIFIMDGFSSTVMDFIYSLA